MTYRILHGKVDQFARHYHGPKFHALLTDPPYHLTSITRRFGKPGSAPAKGDVYARSAAGFMGQDWDGGGVAFRPETWTALAEHLYPGAFGMAFASSRGWHRLAVAIEDAGLIIHPSNFLLGYAYGSGFPKSTRVKDNGKDAPGFGGHRYGLQAIKPALEPIIVFQKPYEGRPVDNITATGAGALNIDAGRIGTRTDSPQYRPASPSGIGNGKTCYGTRDGQEALYTDGRWPANLILQHTPRCARAGDDWQCVDGCPVKMLGEQSGKRAAGGNRTGFEPSAKTNRIYNDFASNNSWDSYDDSGTAARFFFQANWFYEILERLALAEPVYYTAKSSSTERDAGLGALPITNKQGARPSSPDNTGKFPDHDHREIGRNPHPTVKSISLTKHLAGLLLPPDAYAPRRILVPFAGVASEMIGAILAGWETVIGIEMTAKYIPIARARLAWWSDWPKWGQTDVDTILAAAGDEQKTAEQAVYQSRLFQEALWP